MEHVEGTKINLIELPHKQQGRSRNGEKQWLCRCECGKSLSVPASRLKAGYPHSCGCTTSGRLATNRLGTNRRGHGMSDTPEYGIWAGMKYRCLNPKAKQYHNYGGRGIKVCPQWIDSFTTFFKHMGPRIHSHYSLERKDNMGNYEPGNCIWAPRYVQNQNRRNNVITRRQACEILWCKDTNLTAKQVARIFEVSSSVVTGIWARRTWMDIRPIVPVRTMKLKYMAP